MIRTKKCTINILDQVNCLLVGLHPDHLNYFYELLAEFAPNYLFLPKFQFSNWDGKIRFFSKTGKTYVNLLDTIVPKLIEIGYKIKLVDKRNQTVQQPKLIDEHIFSHIITEEGKPWVMRDYQVNLVNKLIDNAGGVAIAGTGAGKTCCCAALARAYEISGNHKSIIIVPDKNLSSQTSRDYAFFGLDVGRYGGGVKDLDHQHLVSTWQSLKNNPNILNDFDVVIVDECHGIKGNVLSKLLNEHGKEIPIRFGVTGTLPKLPADAMSVRISVGTTQITIPAHSLIKQKHLSSLHIDVIQHDIDLQEEYEEYLENNDDLVPLTYAKFKNELHSDWAGEKRHLQNHKERLEWLVEYISAKRNQKKGNVLCLIDGIRFGKKLAKMIPDAIFLYGNDDTDEREAVFERFKTEDHLVVIASVKIASTGLNINRIFNLMFIDIGKSFIRVIQTIGRGLRKAYDKDYVHVTDICSNLKFSRRHLTSRTKYYKEAKYGFKKRLIELKRMISPFFSE